MTAQKNIGQDVYKRQTYDKEKLKKQVKALNCAQKENQVAPENAYVAYGDSQFEIVPETEGCLLYTSSCRQSYSHKVHLSGGRR